MLKLKLMLRMMRQPRQQKDLGVWTCLGPDCMVVHCDNCESLRGQP